MDDGRLTDGKGRTVDFSNTVIIMTSNLGAAALLKAADEGDFDNPEETMLTDGSANEESEDFSDAWEDAKEQVMAEVKKKFPPELINRLDDLLVFTPLKRHHLVEVVRILIKQVESRLKEAQSTRETPLEISIDLQEEACDYVVDEAYDPAFGVRPLRRFIEREIVTALAQSMVKGELKEKNTVHISVVGEGDDRDISLVIESTGEEDKSMQAKL
eukprot:SAG31_NODE_5569_length_2452_cov_1.940501_3_plen_215_part_00